MLLHLENKTITFRYRRGMVLGDLLSVLQKRGLHYTPLKTIFIINGNRIGSTLIWSSSINRHDVILIRKRSSMDTIGNVNVINVFIKHPVIIVLFSRLLLQVSTPHRREHHLLVGTNQES